MAQIPLLIANWKMYGNRSTNQQLLAKIKVCINSSHAKIPVSVVILPPAIFLEQTTSLLKGSTIAWGAQNMASEEKGAYTGEIAGAMLKDFGCRYVLLGHSERRQHFGETDVQIARKFALAKQLGLTPILCVGESLADYQAKKTMKVIQQQLQVVITSFGFSAFQNTILAYEPIWAIGTGLSATPETAQTVCSQIRQWLTQGDHSLADKLAILYGGSIKPENAKSLFSMPDIDGGLVGAASLDAQAFLKIYEALPKSFTKPVSNLKIESD
jgi:triosephosphate isomerase (TIM)